MRLDCITPRSIHRGPVNVLLVQHDIVWEDKPANHRTVTELVERAAPPPRTLIVLAELFDTGFTMNAAAIADGRTERFAQELARRHDCWVLAGHAAPCSRGGVANCATLFTPEAEERGRYEKVQPFGAGPNPESRHYTAGERLVLCDIDGAQTAPLICYDLRFPELWRLATFAGAELFLIGASWPRGRQEHWRSLAIARAIENQAFVVAVNRIGRDPGSAYAGGSFVVGPRGEILADAEERSEALLVELDFERLREWRAAFPVLRDARPSLRGAITIDRS